MKKKLSIAVSLLFLVNYSVLAEGSEPVLKFENHGHPQKEASLSELQRMSKPRKSKIFEWHEEKEATYMVLPLTAILDIVYQNKWKKADDVVFIANDGYKQSVSSAKLREHRALLAFDRVDGNQGFTLVNHFQNNEHVDLAPFYLVWDNLKDKELMATGVDDVPYKVVTIDIRDFSDQNPNSAPPSNAHRKIKQGFLAFRKYCSTCHSVRGDGGNKAPDLAEISTRQTDDQIRQRILDPRAVNPQSTMVSLRETRPKTADTLATEILAYLKEMGKGQGQKKK